jgi:hypothetical protein
LLSEVEPNCKVDLLGVGIKPAFDLGYIDGWVAKRHFVTPSREPRAQALADVGEQLSAMDHQDVLLRAIESLRSMGTRLAVKKARAKKLPTRKVNKVPAPKKKRTAKKKKTAKKKTTAKKKRPVER